MEAISKCFDGPSGGDAMGSTTAIIATTVVMTVTLLSFARLALWPRKREIIRGLSTTKISRPSSGAGEEEKVTYRPDFFPGGRDVFTPYGNIHVYEFGPEDGRKVLFVHGLSTSCMTLRDIANPLAERGCRVMLFDLFGRGYTDAPGDLPYDTRLFVTQMLLVLASSPLPWTGDNGFHLVGYSLGGGIAANFAATFPRMVETLVLLAPAGLIRPENIGRVSRIVFKSGIVPERLLGWLAKRRLRTPIDRSVSKKKKVSANPITSATMSSGSSGREQEDFIDVAIQEVHDEEPSSSATAEVVSPTPFELDVAAFVEWSIDHNAGFVPAMMSTIRYAPMMEQHAYWSRLGKVRRPQTTAVLMGRHDNLIQLGDHTQDALPLLRGKDNVFWRVVPGAHNFPFTHGDSALKVILEFWDMK